MQLRYIRLFVFVVLYIMKQFEVGTAMLPDIKITVSQTGPGKFADTVFYFDIVKIS